MLHAHAAVVVHVTDDYGIKVPLRENLDDFFCTAFVGNDQHALLRFRQKHFVGSHTGFALRD